jgi:hypothetical protein
LLLRSNCWSCVSRLTSHRLLLLQKAWIWKNT